MRTLTINQMKNNIQFKAPKYMT